MPQHNESDDFRLGQEDMFGDIKPMMLEIFLYGLYTALFCCCVYLLAKSKKRQHVPLLLVAIVMFGLATADVATKMQYLCGNNDKESLVYRDYLYNISDFFANGLLIFRLFVIWDRRKLVILVPCIALVAANIIAVYFYDSSGNIAVYLLATVPVNILNSALLAGRIWWVAHRTNKILGRGYTRNYIIAIAVIVESGIISSVYILIAAVGTESQYVMLVEGIFQIVGIAPTLVIVQVLLGREVQDIQTTIKSANADCQV